MTFTLRGVVLSALFLGLVSCARQADPVPLSLALKPSSAPLPALVDRPAEIIVAAFGDDRSDRTKLGVHQSLWGTTEPLTVRQGTVGEVTAKALADYLARKGWRVRYAASTPDGEAPVVITGKVLESSVDAHGSVGSTDIMAKNKLVVHARNQADGSSITQTVSHNGVYTVFWYSADDAEEILAEVMERNFEKFVNQTRFDGSVLRFK